MEEKDFYLSALVDFPDDVICGLTRRENLIELFKKLKECNVKRIFWYYYGEAEDSYYKNFKMPNRTQIENMEKMLQDIPDYNKFAVETAHSLGMEIVGVMRTSESGDAAIFPEFYEVVRDYTEKCEISSIGGYLVTGNKYVTEHPESRIKRRTFDIDEAAENKNICKIELRKQNDIPTRIKKENIKIYVSDNNYNYREFKGDFNFEISTAICEDDVWVVAGAPYVRKRISKKGETVSTIILSGFEIKEQYVAVTCNCGALYDPENTETAFKNALSKAIYCYADDGTPIPVTVGNKPKVWRINDGTNWKESGLAFDDGFGNYFEFQLDSTDKEGVYGVARGKNRYVHSHLCECDEGVQKYWFEALENCLNNGFDMITSREENHSIMINDPFAFGYNDSIKEKYFEVYGKCEEKDMDPQKIAKIRGDVYSQLFIEGAKKVRESGKKVALQLNLEMLHDPIPLDRIFAYPMNVEWQWRRWIDEIKPDEVVIRTFCYMPEFVFSDPQSMEIINAAKVLNVPMTYERYIDKGDFIKDYKTVKDSGLFDSITLYETCCAFGFDENGKIFDRNPEFIKALKELD